MNGSKIHFSTEETALLQNQHWLLTKNIIIGKIYSMMGALSEQLQQTIINVPPELTEAGPKISKGENYEGLPYVMLDYPRRFQKENICALRTFFWWGRFVSVTLHIKGFYQNCLVPALAENIDTFAEAKFRISINGDEWDHNIEGKHYQPLSSFEKENLTSNLYAAPFLKISSVINLEDWDNMQETITSKHLLIYRLLIDQLPKR